jgi:hypothetical protein
VASDVRRRFSARAALRDSADIHLSGLLKPAVMRKLRSIAALEKRDFDVCSARDSSCFGGDALFDVLFVCDWSETKLAASEIDRKMEVIVNGDGGRTAQFIPLTKSLMADARWSEIDERCFVIEEPEVNTYSLLPILRYLDHQNGLEGGSGLANQPDCMDVFIELSEARGIDLADVFNVHTELSLGGAYQQTESFQVRETPPKSRLRRFLTNLDETSLVCFVETMAARWLELAWTSEDLYRSLCKMSEALLGSPSSTASYLASATVKISRGSFSGSIALLWAATVLAWERRMLASGRVSHRRGPQSVLFLLDQVCRDFLRRVEDFRLSQDPLHDLWRELHSRCDAISAGNQSGLARSRAALGEALCRSAPPNRASIPWMNKLVQLGQQALDKATCGEEERRSHDEEDPTGRFEYGH